MPARRFPLEEAARCPDRRGEVIIAPSRRGSALRAKGKSGGPALPTQRLFSKLRTARKDYGSQNATEREKTRRVLEVAGKCSAVGAPRAGRNSVSRQPGGRRLGELRGAVSAQPREGRGLGVDLGGRARQLSQPALRCSPPACWRSAVPSAAQPSRPDARR